MRRLTAVAIVFFGCAVGWVDAAQAQGRGANDWMTSNGNAQRPAWVRTDAKISSEGLQKPGFQFLWKLKLKNEPKGLNSLIPPATMERLVGYRGFRMLGFVAGSGDNIFTIDTDLGRMEWEKQLASSAPPQAGSLACPGGMTTGVARPTVVMPSLAGGRGGGSGRGDPAKSAVGEPGKGAVILAQLSSSPSSPQSGSQPGAQQRPPRSPILIYALASDGKLHTLLLSNGAEYQPPVNFLPPNANANGLIVIDNVAYVATEGGCGGAPNGVWSLDLGTKQVTTWQANVSGSAGPAFGGDGTLYVATGGEGESPNSLVALEPKTLKVKGWYSAGNQEFSSSPVIFEYKGKTLIAAATRDGRIHLLESSNLGGADHQTALYTTPALSKAADFVPGALASWQDASGTRWILAPTVGPLAAEAGFTANGIVTKGAVVAWKLVEQNGIPTLKPAWVSRNLVSPLPPTIINDVVFVTSSGEFRTNDSKLTAKQRALRSSHAVLYALEGKTGKELWKSGTTITSFTRGGALSGGAGQIYLGTYDGTLYAFGFPMEH